MTPNIQDPLSRLPHQENEVSPDFVHRFRRRLDRRVATTQMASFYWKMPSAVLLEMASLIGDFVYGVGGKKEIKR
jgi:hypothetical protein